MTALIYWPSVLRAAGTCLLGLVALVLSPVWIPAVLLWGIGAALTGQLPDRCANTPEPPGSRPPAPPPPPPKRCTVSGLIGRAGGQPGGSIQRPTR